VKKKNRRCRLGCCVFLKRKNQGAQERKKGKIANREGISNSISVMCHLHLKMRKRSIHPKTTKKKKKPDNIRTTFFPTGGSGKVDEKRPMKGKAKNLKFLGETTAGGNMGKV